MSSAPGSRAATAVSGLTDESVIGDIFGYYCSLVYEAVLESIVSSLLVIGDCVKPPGRMQSGIEVESRKTSRFVPKFCSVEKQNQDQVIFQRALCCCRGDKYKNETEKDVAHVNLIILIL